MLSDWFAGFFNLWADIAVAVTLGLYLVFVILYGRFYNWRDTRAGRSVFFSFLSLLSVSAISFLAIWVGQNFWLRPLWRAVTWTAATWAALYLLFALLKRWNRAAPVVIEPKTGNIPVNKEAAMAYTTPELPVTTDESGTPTSRPQPKVVAATVGAGVGAALTTVGVYVFEATTAVDLPPAVEGAFLVLITAALSFVAGYVKRPSANAS